MATTHWKIYWKPRKRDFRFNIKQKLKFRYIPLAADHMLLSAVTVVSDTVDSVVGADHKHCRIGHSSLAVEALPLASTEATWSPLGNKRHIFLLQY